MLFGSLFVYGVRDFRVAEQILEILQQACTGEQDQNSSSNTRTRHLLK